MYKIYKIENGKIRPCDPWYNANDRAKRQTKRRLKKRCQEINRQGHRFQYVVMCVG